ncbi:MAG: calcium/sodium antiporter [Verrucomicrobiota bacterium]|jgi:cation:H+ antiporter
MLADLLNLFGGMVLLIAGAEFLLRGAAALAIKLGISALVIGLTIVAFGTSSPELVISARAAWNGESDIALGTVIGSNICNILLILGIACLIRPITIHRQVMKLDLPVMIGVSVALALILLSGGISRLFGILLFLGVIGYTVCTLKISRKMAREDEGIREEDIVDIPELPAGILLLVLFIILGPILLGIGSDLMLRGAISIAERLGISNAVIALTIVAVGGSLPELATAVAASVRDKADIVVGNVVGSNIFNILSVLGVAAIVQPLVFAQGPDSVGWMDVGVMLVVAFLCLLFMRSGFVLKRWEGLLMLAGYAGYIVYLIA